MADKGKIIGISILLLAFVVGALNSILVTGPSILDTDSSTYIIVVLLMLPVFIIFTAKEDLQLAHSLSSIISGIAIFALFVIVTVFSRLSMSFAFASYRIDAFMLPIFIIALVFMLFGLDGIRKTKLLIIYAFFASPLLLLPIFSLNGSWAGLNASIVYNVLKALGIPISRIGNTFSGFAGSTITISTACVSLGTFAALIMFMIPVAYLYEGAIKNKLLWLLGGFVLMLILNLFRIGSVMLSGLYYGLSSSLLVFHMFAGQILFYIAIIVMILIGSKFNLHIKKLKPTKHSYTAKRFRLSTIAYISIILAIIFGIFTFVLTSAYESALYAPALSFNSNSSIVQQLAIAKVVTSLEGAHDNILQLYSSNTMLIYGLSNKTTNSTLYVLVSLYNVPEGGTIVTSNYSSISNMHAVLLDNGISLKAALIKSGNSTFIVNYFALPYSIEGSYVTENYEMFVPLNKSSGVQFCSIGKSESIPNGFESALYNTLSMHSSNSTYMCASYMIANGA